MMTYKPTSRGLAILLLALAVTVPTLATNAKVALLRQSQGEITVDGAPARKFQALKVGDTLTLGPDAQLTVDYLKSGVRQVATGPSRLTVNADGLSGQNVVSEKAARVDALANIGAQKKMGGGAVRGNENKPLDVKVTHVDGRPRFEVFQNGAPFQGEYYAALFREDDLEFGWEREPLVGPVVPVPEQVLAQMKPGVSYTVSVGMPDQLELMEGRRLRCQIIPQEQLEDLEYASRNLREIAISENNAEPLLLLMDLYNEKDMVEKAAEAGQQALDLALKSDRKPVYLDELSEALTRLYDELDDEEAVKRVETLTSR